MINRPFSYNGKLNGHSTLSLFDFSIMGRLDGMRDAEYIDKRLKKLREERAKLNQTTQQETGFFENIQVDGRRSPDRFEGMYKRQSIDEWLAEQDQKFRQYDIAMAKMLREHQEKMKIYDNKIAELQRKFPRQL